MPKIKITILIISICFIFIGCGTATYTTKYYIVDQFKINEEQTPQSQTIDGVTITLQPISHQQKEQFKQKFKVKSLNLDGKEFELDREYTIPFFEGWTVFNVTINNQTNTDLSMGGFQFLWLNPDGEPVNALTKEDIINSTPNLESVKELFGQIKYNHPRTDDRALAGQIGSTIGRITKDLSLISGINREVYAGTNATGLLIFPTNESNSTAGKFSIRERIGVNKDIARGTQTQKYEYKTMYLKRYYRDVPNDADKYKFIKQEITKDEYESNAFNPEKFWYDSDKKKWISGEPPAK